MFVDNMGHTIGPIIVNEHQMVGFYNRFCSETYSVFHKFF